MIFNAKKLDRQIETLDKYLLKQYQKEHDWCRVAQSICSRLPMDQRARHVARITGRRNLIRGNINRLKRRVADASA